MQICTNLPAVLRRATNISEDVEIASQPVMPRTLRLHAQDIRMSADDFAANSLRQLHGSDSPLSSDPPDIGMVDSYASHQLRSRLDPSAKSPASPDKGNTRATTSTMIRKVSAGKRTENDSMHHPRQLPNTTSLLARSGHKLLKNALSDDPNSLMKPLHAKLNKIAGTSRTHDHLTDGGSYALPAPLPLDPRKRLLQEEAFRSIRPVTGKGPYAYYNDSISPSECAN